MTKNEAITLQEMMMQEAVALLRVTERQGDTSKFERVIPLIGSTWWLPVESSHRCLDTIAKEKNGIQVLEEEHLPMNAAPAKTVSNLLALIETAMEAKTLQDCQTILGLAQELAIIQNLVDEIEQHTTVDLTPGAGNLLDEFYWEILSPWRGESSMLNTGPAPRSGAAGSTLWSILEARPHPKYYLSQKACQGILRRSNERDKELPWKLKQALKIQAGLMTPERIPIPHSGPQAPEGVDGYNGDLTGEVTATLGTNCGMSTGRNGVMMPMAFAQNQRDEVRDLHAVAGALGSQPGMKQQTYVAGVVTKGNGDCFLSEEKHTVLSTGGGQAGQGYPCVLVTAQKEPEVLCLNDQGGQFMSSSKNITGTLRAQMNQHQPLVLATQQGGAEIGEGICPTITASAGMSGNNQPILFENHGIDSRYNGPLHVSPTIGARTGTGGNNLPLVEQKPEVYCIVGNVIDRQPQNGGNGAGFQQNISYMMTSMDRHAICEPYQQVVGALCRGDEKGVGSQYVSQDKCIMETPNLIRRLTPLECERLQGFPDGWTDIPGASDSARYKALGNSVAIPCVDFVMRGIAAAIRAERKRRRGYLIPASKMAA